MRKIEFSKYHGQGNDFVIIDASGSDITLAEEDIRSICDRHFGVGADGIIMVKPSESQDFYMDYYNMDGSKAEMCGNGIRCMSGFISDKGLSDKRNLNIDTLDGVKAISMEEGGKSDISVDMGEPVFDPELIPVDIDMEEVFNYKVNIADRELNINCISMGNPHCIIALDKASDFNNIPLDTLGPMFENHELFPNKTNVEFIKPLTEDSIQMRVWERGVGETLACGTGACAAGVCAIRLNIVKGPDVVVEVPGGRLKVNWGGKNSTVLLKGKVKHVFDGVYTIE